MPEELKTILRELTQKTEEAYPDFFSNDDKAAKALFCNFAVQRLLFCDFPVEKVATKLQIPCMALNQALIHHIKTSQYCPECFIQLVKPAKVE
jgi:FPC/CPF motif-containing protein YcgG